MGGDGGVIATQREFLRGAKRSSSDGGKTMRSDEQLLRATTCCLSGEKLVDPIVCCELGNFYNKDSMLLALLEKRLPTEISHIRSTKDLKTLRLTNISSKESGNTAGSSTNSSNGNGSGNGHASGSSTDSTAVTPLFMCPVTAIELNGRHPFFALWTTGWVLSEKAIRELGMEALQTEYGPFSESDMVRLLPLGPEVDASRAAMNERRKSSKTAKKRSQAEDGGFDTDERKAKKRAEKDDSEQVHSLVKPKSSLTAASKVMKEANQAIHSQEKSQIFKNLFHKDGERDKTDRDLFMAVAGMRYTLG